MEILFEKILHHDSINTEFLIEASQKRQDFIEDLKCNREYVEKGIVYYKMLCDLMQNIKSKRCRLSVQPLFRWNDDASTSWLFEKLHVEKILLDGYVKMAEETSDLKNRRSLYVHAMEYAIKCMNTLESNVWEDASIAHLPMFQTRYHLYSVLKCAARYYETINDYSKVHKNTANSLCIKRAYEYMDTASHLWKRSKEDDIECQRLKAQYTLDYVKTMNEEKCGEQIALLQPFVTSGLDIEELHAYYKMLVQFNENVYYNEVKTSITLSPPSLTELLRTLPKTTADI